MYNSAYTNLHNHRIRGNHSAIGYREEFLQSFDGAGYSKSLSFDLPAGLKCVRIQFPYNFQLQLSWF